MVCTQLKACLQGGRVTLALTHFLFFLCRVYLAARASQVGGLPYLCARVNLTGGLTFSLANTPERVNPPIRVKLFYLFPVPLSVENKQPS